MDSLSLSNDLQAIVGIRHRGANPLHLKASKNYIERCFVEQGLQTNRQAFDYSGWKAENLIGRLPGQMDENRVCIVCAHFDTVSISPGADDNGSGVVSMLAVARALSRYSFQHTLKFIGFDLEEDGLLGSAAYVAKGMQENEQIDGVINLETVGYFNDQAGTQQVPVGFDLLFPDLYQTLKNQQWSGDFIFCAANSKSSELRTLFDHCAANFVPELKAYSVAVARNGEITPDLRRSDHASFWDRGYPAIMLTDSANFRYPYYHTSNDKSDWLNYDFMADTVKAVVATVAQLAGIQHAGIGESDVANPYQDVRLSLQLYDNMATLTWPSEPAGSSPQSLRQLTEVWADVTNQPSTDSNTNTIRITPLKPQGFFRLIRR